MGDVGQTLGLGPDNQVTSGSYGLNTSSDLLSQLLGARQPQPMDERLPGQPDPVERVLAATPNALPNPVKVQNGPDDDIAITGFKPHKRTTLGFIADAVLSTLAGGKFTPFADKVNRENMQEAMEGFTSDPLASIQKLARLPGHEKDAYAMYKTYVDDQRQQGNLDRQNQVLGNQNDAAGLQIVASVMNGAKDENSYNKLRAQAAAIARAKHMSEGLFDSIFPSTYDEALARAGIQSAVKVKDQEKLANDAEYRGKRLEQGDRRLDIQQGNLNERIRKDNMPGKGRVTNPKDHYINTKYGIGKVINGGQNLQVETPDGSRYAIYQSIGPNQWRLAGYQAKEGE